MKALRSIVGAGALVLLLGCASTPTRYQSSRYPDSEALQASVKTALWQDPTVAPFDLNVGVARSTVHLTGMVDTPEQKRRAGEIARAIPSVTAVDNDIVVNRLTAANGVGTAARGEVGRTFDDPAVLLGRVLASPDSYYGKALSVEGTVDSVLSPNAFTVYSSGLRDNPLLVLARDVRNVTPGEVVQITGELQPFNRMAAAQRFNAELEPRKFDTWVNRAALLADVIRR